MSWVGLRHKGVEVLFPEEWNAAVDALNDLYGWLTDGTNDINVADVYAAYGYFSGLVYSGGKPVIRDGDPVNIYDIFQPGQNSITQAIDQSAATQYLGSISNKINAISMDAYGRVGIIISDPLDEYGYVRTSVFRIDYTPVTSKLDQIISNIYDLKPARSTPTQDLANYTLQASGVVEVVKTNLDNWSTISVSIQAVYSTAATAGVRVRWLYSPDGVNYDTPQDAESAGNYADLTYAAGATRQRTVRIPILAPYVKVQIVNQDSLNAVTVTMWSWLVR